MKKLLLILVIPFFYSCGKLTIDKPLEKLYDSFIVDMYDMDRNPIQLCNLIMTDELEYIKLGRSYTAKATVIINKKRWKGLSSIEKKIIVYHELGHCMLGLKHTEKGGIMNAYPLRYTDKITEEDFKNLFTN